MSLIKKIFEVSGVNRILAGSGVKPSRNINRLSGQSARFKKTVINRGLSAAAFVGAGYAASGIIQNAAQQERAYRGKSMYDSMYGDSANSASSLAIGAGYFFGAESLFGVNPVQGVMRYHKKTKHLKADMRKARRRANDLNAWNPTDPKKRHKDKRKPDYSNAVDPKDPRRRQQYEDYLVRGDRDKTLYGPQPLEAERYIRAQRVADAGVHKRHGIHLIPGLSTGLVAAGGILALQSPYMAGTAAVGVSTMLTLGASKKLRGIIRNNPGKIAAGAATVVTGAAIGVNRPLYPSAEGNIESVVEDKQSPISKLNYSTAGLVQSIHNNRR